MEGAAFQQPTSNWLKNPDGGDLRPNVPEVDDCVEEIAGSVSKTAENNGVEGTWTRTSHRISPSPIR